MPIELHEKQARVTLNTIRRLYRRNSRFTLYKLIQKIHPAEMAWVFRRDLLLPPLLILLVFPVIF